MVAILAVVACRSHDEAGDSSDYSFIGATSAEARQALATPVDFDATVRR